MPEVAPRGPEWPGGPLKMRPPDSSEPTAIGAQPMGAASALLTAITNGRGRPLEQPGSAERVAPFALTALFALALTVALPGSSGGEEIMLAGGAIAIGTLLTLWIPWFRLPRFAQAAPPLIFLAVVVFVRDAQGGEASNYTPMVALTVIWFALYGTRWELIAGILGAAAAIAVPVLLGSPELYPDSELTLAATYGTVLGVAGLATSTLVRQGETLLAEVTLLARTDPLTGLANRRGWNESLRREIARASRDGAPISVAILDLDHFKAFNDRYGHAAGDRLLKESASRWSDQVRAMDLIARYGGEEFAFMLPGASLADAAQAIERIRGFTPADIKASAGVAEWDGEEDPQALLARADHALYGAKRAGRDRILVAPPPHKRGSESRRDSAGQTQS